MVFLALDPRATLGMVGVLLALLGGCGAFGSNNAPEPPGSICGTVWVEGVDLMPANPQGWVIRVEGQDNGNLVDNNGSYAISDVTPGKYNVVLQPPADSDIYYSCDPTGCQYSGVQVVAGTATMRVDFRVHAMPAPPF